MRLAALVGAALVAGAVAVASPRPTPAATLSGNDAATAELLAAVNALRASAGLAPLLPDSALAAVARRTADEAVARGTLAVDGVDPMQLTYQLRAAGYRPHAWRQRVVQGPADAAAVLRHWRETDPATFSQVVLGDFEVLGAARAAGAEPPLWAFFVALPQGTWERRRGARLDDLDAVRATVLHQVNSARAEAGLPPLAVEPRLTAAAQEHAGDMLRREFYDHRSPGGGGPPSRARAAGYRYRWVAENIAKGLFVEDEVVPRWMASSGHRRNILDPHAVEAGIGVAWGEQRDGEVVALWVLLLGAPAPGR